LVKFKQSEGLRAEISLNNNVILQKPSIFDNIFFLAQKYFGFLHLKEFLIENKGTAKPHQFSIIMTIAHDPILVQNIRWKNIT